MKTRVALYIRVSTEEQAKEGFSLEAQEATLSQHCENLGYIVVGKYIDDGKSGKDMNRPALQELLKDCSQKKFDIVLVWKLSRLSRKLKDTLQLIEDFEKDDVSFLSYSEQFYNSKNNSTNKLMLSMVGGFAEFERSTIVENVKLGMNQRAKQGKWNGGRILGYDIVNKELILNEDEANIIRMIFNMYVNGKGCIYIRDKLNELNLKTKYGKAFTHIAILTILDNPTYKGFIRHGRTTGENKKRIKQENIIIVKGIHEAIIDEESFDKAQQITAHNRRTTPRMPSNPHLLSGILKCPDCGGRMNFQPAGKRNNKNHGGYYTCSNYKNFRTCRPRLFRAKHLERSVLNRIKSIASSTRIIEDIINEMNSNQGIDTEIIKKQITDVEKQIRKYESRMDAIKQQFISGDLTIDEYREFKSELEMVLTDLGCSKETISLEYAKACNTAVDANDVLFVLENFDALMENADVQMKKQLVESLIERIEINLDSTINEFVFNFEVPNPLHPNNQSKSDILICDTVHRD
ncbi:recombinase family protein [Cohnella panacarvi]|uniref:recombinase family protein n=1 Tax=Cohnella panacarvi TaxID=400776 RepID=UPI00047C7848|nr:recombinase family protein [Cohnella panacarvi]